MKRPRSVPVTSATAQRPGRWVTKYAWGDIKALLGMEFDARNVIVATLPPGLYFGAESSRPVLVANWDGTFDSLRGAAL